MRKVFHSRGPLLLFFSLVSLLPLTTGCSDEGSRRSATGGETDTAAIGHGSVGAPVRYLALVRHQSHKAGFSLLIPKGFAVTREDGKGLSASPKKGNGRVILPLKLWLSEEDFDLVPGPGRFKEKGHYIECDDGVILLYDETPPAGFIRVYETKVYSPSGDCYSASLATALGDEELTFDIFRVIVQSIRWPGHRTGREAGEAGEAGDR